MEYGDNALVMSPHSGLAVVYIVSVKDTDIILDSDIEYKYLVAPIDKTYWTELCASADNMYQDILDAMKKEEVNNALADVPSEILERYTNG